MISRQVRRANERTEHKIYSKILNGHKSQPSVIKPTKRGKPFRRVIWQKIMGNKEFSFHATKGLRVITLHG